MSLGMDFKKSMDAYYRGTPEGRHNEKVALLYLYYRFLCVALGKEFDI
jgi:hypothetical protein